MTDKVCLQRKSNNFSSQITRGSTRSRCCVGGYEDCSGTRFSWRCAAKLERAPRWPCAFPCESISASTWKRRELSRARQTGSSVPSPKSLGFRCVQNGSSARREEGAYLDRYVTDEQRSSRPIFNPTLRAAASWLFFRVARSTGMIQIQALRSRLEKQPTDLRRNPRDLGDGTLALNA